MFCTLTFLFSKKKKVLPSTPFWSIFSIITQTRYILPFLKPSPCSPCSQDDLLRFHSLLSLSWIQWNRYILPTSDHYFDSIFRLKSCSTSIDTRSISTIRKLLFVIRHTYWSYPTSYLNRKQKKQYLFAGKQCLCNLTCLYGFSFLFPSHRVLGWWVFIEY